MMNQIVVFGEGHKIISLFKVGKDLEFNILDPYFKNDLMKVLERKDGFGLTKRQDNQIIFVPVQPDEESFSFAVKEALVAEGFNAYVISQTKTDLLAFFDKKLSDMSIKEPAFLDIMKLGEEDVELFAKDFFESLAK